MYKLYASYTADLTQTKLKIKPLNNFNDLKLEPKKN